MTATLNSDCSTLTLNTSSLELAEDKTFNSLTLKYRTSCASTETEVDISELIETIADNQIDVTSLLFYGNETSDSFCDGVYYFQLETNYTIDDETYLAADSVCVLVDCSLKCKVIDYFIATKDRKAHYLYYALKLGGECDSCYCTEMCSMYTELKLLLNDNSITFTDTDCGCT